MRVPYLNRFHNCISVELLGIRDRYFFFNSTAMTKRYHLGDLLRSDLSEFFRPLFEIDLAQAGLDYILPTRF